MVIPVARVLEVLGGVRAASVLLSGCVSTVAGIAMRDGHAVPSDVPLLKESALDKVLLSIDEVNEIMGVTDIEVTSELEEMTNSSGKVSDPDCLGAMYGAEEPVYDGSGWTAVRDVVAREPEDENDHWVEQTAVLYPSADDGEEVLRQVPDDLGELRGVIARGGRSRIPARRGRSATSPQKTV